MCSIVLKMVLGRLSLLFIWMLPIVQIHLYSIRSGYEVLLLAICCNPPINIIFILEPYFQIVTYGSMSIQTVAFNERHTIYVSSTWEFKKWIELSLKPLCDLCKTANSSNFNSLVPRPGYDFKQNIFLNFIFKLGSWNLNLSVYIMLLYIIERSPHSG